jgi:hypothetical protein
MAAKATTAGHGGPALCGAKKKQGPGNCTQVAGWGVPGVTTGPCKLHGGATRSHKTAAEREQARQACALFGLEMEDRDPGEVLLAEVTRTRRSIAWHEAELAMLIVAEKDENDEKVDRLKAEWRSERKHLADVTSKALHAGVARRTLELQEDMARQVVGVLGEFARRLGLDPASPAVREAGREALQLVAGGQG